MTRRKFNIRPDWHEALAADGYHWHSDGGVLSWREGVAYVVTQSEADLLRRTANELHDMFRQAAAEVVSQNWWSRLGIAERHVELIRTSWERAEPAMLGRFDFILDANGQPKLIEYNADTALTLVETALVQARWRDDVAPGAVQWNTLCDQLVSWWRASGFDHVHCAWRPRHQEIEGTCRFMAQMIRKAGLRATLTALHCIGWDSQRRRFVDMEDSELECCTKLYPWEWMLDEPFAVHLAEGGCKFLEPAWKCLFSNKGILAILWEMFPQHPALLPCFRSAESFHGQGFVSKPLWGREGQNVRIVRDGCVVEETGGEYGQSDFIHQGIVEGVRSENWLPQLGVWMVGDESVSIGIRECGGWIIGDNSPFVPHLIEVG